MNSAHRQMNQPKNGTILVIDDNHLNLRLLETALTQSGYGFVGVDRGEDGLQQAMQLVPDLILLDIDMPGMDGYDVCRSLKEIPKTQHIPVIFVSALPQTLDKLKAFDLGGIDYVNKPYQMGEVLARIDIHLTVQRLRQDLKQTNESLEMRVAERTSTLSQTILALEEQILQRKQAEAALQHHAERLRILHQIDRAILTAQSPEKIVQAALAHLRHLVPCSRASLTLFDFSANEATIQVLDMEGDTALGLGQRMRLDIFSDTDVLQTGHPHVVNDLAAISVISPSNKQLLAEGIRASLNVPLVVRDELLGSLDLGAKVVDAFDNDHVAIATEVAVQIAVAISEAQLLEAEALRRQEAEALRNIAAALNSTLDLEEVLKRILNNVEQVAPYEAAHIMLTEEGLARIVSDRGYATQQLASVSQQRPFAVANIPFLNQVFQSKKPLIIPDTAQSDIWIDNPTISWVRSYVGVPIRLNEAVIGFINLGSSQPNFFADLRLDNLLAFADHAAVALQNAQLHTAATRRAEELTALHNATQAMTSTLETRAVLKQAMAEVNQLLAAGGASVLLHDSILETLTFAAVATRDAEKLIGTSLPSNAGIAGWVVQHRQSAIVHQAQNDPRFDNRIDTLMNQVTESLLAVPLIFQDAVIGVIEVINKATGNFDRYDRDMLESLASSATLAIENANLFEDLEARIEALESTRTQLTQSEKMAALGRLVASIAHEINNPLQSVQTCLTLTREELDSDQKRDKLDRYLDIVEGEIDRISNIVHRMRDFYRPAQPGFQPVDVHPILEGVLALVSKELQNNDINIITNWAANLAPIKANADHLKQVFLNLVLNALDAMPNGGELRLHTCPSQIESLPTEKPIPAVRVTFSDTGGGISPETLNRMFEPFVTTKAGGSGLGLSISYSIIEAHNGKIQASNNPDQGATLTIFLPLASPLNNQAIAR